MSKTAGTPGTVGTPYSNRKRKDVQAAQVTVNTCRISDVSGTVRKAPHKQCCAVFSNLLNVASDGEEVTSAGARQGVPHAGRCHRKGAVTDGGQMRRWDDECRRRRRTQATPRVEVRHTLKPNNKICNLNNTLFRAKL